MINETEQNEREHLINMIIKLQAALESLEDTVTGYKDDLKEANITMWEYSKDPDPDIDTIVHRVELERQLNVIADAGERSVIQRRRLIRMLQSPYFGRVDFRDDYSTDPGSEPLYIGIHSFIADDSIDVLIHDWRAPVSGMFYDYELGKAHYNAPGGMIEGELTAKRQYKITQGELDFYIDTSLAISDDILQRALIGKSAEHMKNIVETIQREQNAVIRNDDADVLVIQGVAGSGKTSVALHRAAYMLYKYKDTLTSKDILIISPSSIFTDYIADVLPQLGEDPPAETNTDNIAAFELENVCSFQTRYEQAVLAVETGDERLAERMRFKSRLEFIGELDDYILHTAKTCFSPKEINIDNHKIPGEYISRRYKQYSKHPIKRRLDMIYNDIRDDIRAKHSAKYMNKRSEFIKQELNGMINIPSLLELYKQFYSYIGKPESFKPAGKKKTEYSDVFPMLYLKAAIDGIKIYKNVKHLIIDEMQDYAPIEYAVLKMMFPCKATILGDKLQLASPQGSSGKDIVSIYSGAQYTEMMKSYRSTYEITQFAGRIIPNEQAECVKRHGPEPSCIACDNQANLIIRLNDILKKHNEQTGQGNLCVICKTSEQASFYYEKLRDCGIEITLLNETGKIESGGIMITTPLAAKGLEFDVVVIPDADNLNYKTETDRQLLYIACTRAMHELILLYISNITELIK